eukprot:Gb_39123 [translate_table: standard]
MLVTAKASQALSSGDIADHKQMPYVIAMTVNAIKFTHEGKVGITLRVTSPPLSEEDQKDRKNPHLEREQNKLSTSQSDSCLGGTLHDASKGKNSNQHSENNDRLAKLETRSLPSMDGDENLDIESDSQEKLVWLHCDVYDTGIGIPEKALPALFKKYMQVSATHARKYGGTGLGLAICKQLFRAGEAGYRCRTLHGCQILPVIWIDVPTQKTSIFFSAFVI